MSLSEVNDSHPAQAISLDAAWDKSSLGDRIVVWYYRLSILASCAMICYEAKELRAVWQLSRFGEESMSNETGRALMVLQACYILMGLVGICMSWMASRKPIRWYAWVSAMLPMVLVIYSARILDVNLLVNGRTWSYFINQAPLCLYGAVMAPSSIITILLQLLLPRVYFVNHGGLLISAVNYMSLFFAFVPLYWICWGRRKRQIV